MKNKIKTKDICVTGMGIALFVALSMCLRVPIFENYYICLGYIVMTVYLYNISVWSGTIVCCVGTFLYCVLIGGLRGMPGWVFGNLVICLMLGYFIKLAKTCEEYLFMFILLSIISIVAVALGILCIKSVVECLLYSQPMFIRVTTNMSAFVADVVTIIISIPISMSLRKPINKIMNYSGGNQ